MARKHLTAERASNVVEFGDNRVTSGSISEMEGALEDVSEAIESARDCIERDDSESQKYAKQMLLLAALSCDRLANLIEPETPYVRAALARYRVRLANRIEPETKNA
jgi:hypothetical protein